MNIAVCIKQVPDTETKIKLSDDKKSVIEDDINFVGKISNASDLIKVLKSSHVFALPSIAEGFGIVIIEAVAAGIPYVASDIPPIREVTNGGIGGLLCEPKNYNDLALKIKTLLIDESKRKLALKHSGELIGNYRWSSLACEIEQVYKKIRQILCPNHKYDGYHTQNMESTPLTFLYWFYIRIERII